MYILGTELPKYHDNENERGQMSPRQGEKGEIPLLPNNVGKKSVNDAGPKQGHDRLLLVFVITLFIM